MHASQSVKVININPTIEQKRADHKRKFHTQKRFDFRSQNIWKTLIIMPAKEKSSHFLITFFILDFFWFNYYFLWLIWLPTKKYWVGGKYKNYLKWIIQRASSIFSFDFCRLFFWQTFVYFVCWLNSQFITLFLRFSRFSFKLKLAVWFFYKNAVKVSMKML